MSEKAATLRVELLRLSEFERWEMIGLLFDSLPKPSGVMSEDDTGFDAEIDRRLADHESGKSKSIPADEFFQQLRATRP